jgi:hypothetical protein
VAAPHIFHPVRRLAGKPSVSLILLRAAFNLAPDIEKTCRHFIFILFVCDMVLKKAKPHFFYGLDSMNKSNEKARSNSYSCQINFT